MEETWNEKESFTDVNFRLAVKFEFMFCENFICSVRSVEKLMKRMKRKVHEDHPRVECDEWLSTRNRKKIRLETFPKRTRSPNVKLLNLSLWQLTQNSQPPVQLKTSTKQSSLLHFFKSPDLKKVESETASNQTDASLASHNNTSVQLDSSEHLSHVATSLQLSQRETNSVEQHNPRETTVTALQQKSSNTRRDTSLEYAHDVSPPPTKHAPVTSVKLDVLVGDEKENVCVSLSCSILPVIKDRGENKHVDADLASCCLLAANQPRSAVRVLHKNGSIITLDTPPGSQHSSSSPTKPRRTVQDDDSIDDLLPRHMSVFSKPVSSKFNKYSDTRKLDSADIQRVNSLCELRDTSNIVPSGSPREGTNGDVVDDVCDMLCSDSLQFTDSSDSSLFQRDECEFNRCDTDWSYCLHNKPCQNGLHSCHSDRQVENTLHCCHSNKPGEFGLHCYYGDATPSFHTESSPQFSCEISDHSPSDNPRIELLGGEHKAECSSLSKFVIEDTITFTDESESFAN